MQREVKSKVLWFGPGAVTDYDKTILDRELAQRFNAQSTIDNCEPASMMRLDHKRILIRQGWMIL